MLVLLVVTTVAGGMLGAIVGLPFAIIGWERRRGLLAAVARLGAAPQTPIAELAEGRAIVRGRACALEAERASGSGRAANLVEGGWWRERAVPFALRDHTGAIDVTLQPGSRWLLRGPRRGRRVEEGDEVIVECDVAFASHGYRERPRAVMRPVGDGLVVVGADERRAKQRVDRWFWSWVVVGVVVTWALGLLFVVVAPT